MFIYGALKILGLDIFSFLVFFILLNEEAIRFFAVDGGIDFCIFFVGTTFTGAIFSISLFNARVPARMDDFFRDETAFFMEGSVKALRPTRNELVKIGFKYRNNVEKIPPIPRPRCKYAPRWIE